MIGFAAQRLMELETEPLSGAAHAERSADRLNQRNGYRERDWENRTGTGKLQIGSFRRGSYFPAFLELRRTVKKALSAVIQEAYVQDISTRSVDALVWYRGMEGITVDGARPVEVQFGVAKGRHFCIARPRQICSARRLAVLNTPGTLPISAAFGLAESTACAETGGGATTGCERSL